MIVVIPDVHAPWGNVKHLDKVLSFIKDHQPEHVVQIGDAYDFFSFSRYARTLNFITPEEELRQGREQMSTLWAAVQWASPQSQCYQMLGNHDVRIKKQVMDRFPEIEAVLDMLDLNSLWRFPGVQFIEDPREPLEIGNVLLHHGDFLSTSTPGARVKYLLRNIVFGHTHQGHVYYLPRQSGALWELSCGHIAYSDALPLSYMPIKVASTVAGFGVVDDYGPRFIPLG